MAREKVIGPGPSDGDYLIWSDKMAALFRDRVITPVCDHPDTDFTEDLLFGVPFQVVRNEVITKGLADFSVGYSHPTYGTLSPDQKALLYTFINFKKHFYACRATYETYRSDLTRLWGGERPTVFDLGCGPGTAGLALCDTLPGAQWDYIGIDSAVPMRSQAEQLFAAARSAGLFGSGGEVRMCTSWNEISHDTFRTPAPTLSICSYLFASSSLNTAVLRDLAGWVCSARASSYRSIVLLVYLNSTCHTANRNYENFKLYIGLDPLNHQPSHGRVQFLKNRNGTTTGSDEFLHELLVLKEG
jgi:hypothetical protein